jgi:hypothetical protein
LTNNIISNNTASGTGPGGGRGGGIFFFAAQTVTLTNNTISYNTGAGVWAELYFDTDIANIYNNIVWNNSAPLGSDLYIMNDWDNNGTPSPVNLYNNDLDLTNGFFIEDDNPIFFSFSDNINLPPEFDTDGYHLTASSPCIDAGATVIEPTDDIDGDSRPQGDDYDIGADEFVGVDLDIASFKATKRVNLGSNKNIVEISLTVKNMGALDNPCPATVVGMQGATELHSETIDVSDAVGKGPTTYDFTPFEVTSAGDIVWTVTVENEDTDVDEATASTIVN